MHIDTAGEFYYYLICNTWSDFGVLWSSKSAPKRHAIFLKFESSPQVVVKSETNQGIMEAWRNAWTWKDNELFIVIEDDVEMSPHWWERILQREMSQSPCDFYCLKHHKSFVHYKMLIRYRALVYAWLKYADLPEIAGVGLQKQTFVATGAGGAFSFYFAIPRCCLNYISFKSWLSSSKVVCFVGAGKSSSYGELISFYYSFSNRRVYT